MKMATRQPGKTCSGKGRKVPVRLMNGLACYCGKNGIGKEMSITAVVEQGIIKLPKEVAWPSGTMVRIEAVNEQPPTLWETLKDFDGIANDLPSDLASKLDHYVHGHPKS